MAPNVTLFPGSSIQNQILTAFRDSFNYTQIVTRYPNVLGTYLPSQLPFGYIDQSFAQDTLPASGLGYSCFSAGLQSTNATEIWKVSTLYSAPSVCTIHHFYPLHQFSDPNYWRGSSTRVLALHFCWKCYCSLCWGYHVDPARLEYLCDHCSYVLAMGHLRLLSAGI